MSYSQIFRRMNRILKSAVNDAYERLTRNEQELADFDAELKRSAGESGAQRARASQSAGAGKPGGQGGRRDGGASGGSNAGGGARGRRKPGEKDDAHYYSILGVTRSATDAQVSAAYKSLMRRYHPDKTSALPEDKQRQAAEKAKLITEAYHIIKRRRKPG